MTRAAARGSVASVKPVTRKRLEAVVDQAARALGIAEADTRRRTILRTLVQETLRVQALDAAEPDAPPPKTPPPFKPPPRGTWDDYPTPIRYPKRTR